jgi:hypothetical protein
VDGSSRRHQSEQDIDEMLALRDRQFVQHARQAVAAVLKVADETIDQLGLVPFENEAANLGG